MNQDPYAAFADPVSAPAAPARPAPARPAAPRPARPARPQIRFADDRDALVRTVLMEAGAEPPEGQQAVAAVVLNRSRQRGLTPQQVVLEPNQFEPWGNPETASRGMSIRPDSPEYQRAAALVDQVIGGVDPTNGADHFYAPEAQRALGRQAPSWATGEPLVIGGHNFYNLGGSDEAARTQAAGADPYAAISEPAPMEEPGLDLAALARGDLGPADVTIDRGLLREGGNVYTINEDGEKALIASEAEWAAMAEDERSNRFSMAMNGRSPEFMAEYDAALAGAENVPAWLANLSQGNSLGLVGEAVAATNFLAPMTEGADRGMAYEAARAAWRDRQGNLLREDPLGSVGMQLLGGLATPGLKGSGDWIGAASGTQRIGRAATVGAGYGGVAGILGSDEADIGSRVEGGLLGAGTGAVSAGLLDAGAQRAFAGAGRRAAGGSAQRRLSRQGVELTPGQMLEPTPVIGPMIRGAEDAISSIPFMGAPVQGARNQGIDTLNRAAVGRALNPIGAKLPKNIETGYEAVRYAQQTLGAAYDDLLPRITAVMDDTFRTDIDGILAQADAELPADLASRLRSLVGGDRVLARASAGDRFSGDEFKAIENTLRTLTERYARSQDVDQQAIADLLVDTRTAFSEMLARSNPDEAARLRSINTGWANLSRVQRAAGGTAALGREGQFTPGELGVAALQGATYGARGRGDALMQDLARDAKAVLPNTLGDSGTAARGAMTGLLGLAATGTVNPVLGVPVVAAGVAYSKPAQKVLNIIYRATDRQSATSALGELQRFAARNPALQPYYQAAVEAVQRAFPSQSQEPAPRGRGLLAPTVP